MQTLAAYPPQVRSLLGADRLPELGPGRPHEAVRAQLQALSAETLCAPQQVRRPDAAAACLAGLWLLHDCFAESHALSQELHTVEGSYWHGILHRREPDAANAKYWFRRVGTHPIFEPLAREAQQLGLRLEGGRWDSFAFIDQCEAQRGTGSAQELLLRQVQRREWDLLFDWCFQQATQTANEG